MTPIADPAHVLTLREYDDDSLRALVARAAELKRAGRTERPLTGAGLVILMQKTSTRTRLSFSAAMQELGGHVTDLDWNQTNFTISPLEHEAEYISRNCQVIMARLRSHADLLRLAGASQVPVINGCCDRHHPSQAVADMLTLAERFGANARVTLTYAGIHNNVANSLVAACTRMGHRLLLVTPMRNDAAWDDDLMDEGIGSGLVEHRETLDEALDETDAVYTDTWLDMEFFGDPAYTEELEERKRLLMPARLSVDALRGRDVVVMHDMPVHPGFEIDEELIRSPQSVVYTQAENRLYAAKALLMDVLRR